MVLLPFFAPITVARTALGCAALDQVKERGVLFSHLEEGLFLLLLLLGYKQVFKFL